MAVTDKDKIRTIVTIDLGRMPDRGMTTVSIRLSRDDMQTVMAAAHCLWLSRADFVRTAVVQAAIATIKANT